MVFEIKGLLANRNNRVLLGNIGGTVVIKGFSVVVSLLATPAYIEYFSDNAVLGIWYTLVAALNWILTFDFGVGNGLRNKLAIALAEKDDNKAQQLVSTAYITIGLIVIAAVIAGMPIAASVDWALILNYGGSAISAEVFILSVSVVFIGTMLQFVLKLLTSVLFALQKTALNNSLFLLGNVILLVYLVVVHPQNASEALLGLSMAQVVTVNLPLLIGSVYFFSREGRSFRPSLRCWDRQAVKDVVGLGGAFFIVQIAFLFINSSNEYLITLLYESSAVVDYQVYYKCFFLIITVFTLAVQPVWSAMTVAIAEGRYTWVKKVYAVFNFGAAVATVLAVVLALVFPEVVSIWLQDNAIETPISVSLIFALLVSVTLFVNSSTCVANASNRLKPQIVFSVFGAGLKIALSVVFARLGFPWESIVLANSAVLIPLLIGQVFANCRYLSKVK